MEILVWLFGILAYCSETNAYPSVRSVFYLHTTPRTWNEAKLICEAQTAELFRVKNGNTINELKFVDGMTEWNGNFSKLMNQDMMWLAMYETQDAANQFLNHGCIKPAETFSWPWATGQPNDPTNHELCVAMDSSYKWSLQTCNQSYYFICQRHDGECWFDPRDNTIATAQTITIEDVVVDSEADCATSCRNGWINDTECWGFSYRASDNTCRVHYHTESAIFISNTPNVFEHNANWTFYAKICVGGLLRNVNVNYIDNDIEPRVRNCTDLVATDEALDDAMCYCECSDPPPMWEPTISSLSLKQKIEQIVAALTIDSKNTSAAQRKLISVMDVRPSAQSIGYIGVVFLSIVFGSIIILDLNVLVSHTNNLLKSLKRTGSSDA
ncbi:uncharacterized protein [Haliotis asinina]|uniref:uncharacterized protein n=1 Tax=Haliotis asinina TaxID=109174 RepID=UPI00353201E6